jgi:ferredoxin
MMRAHVEEDLCIGDESCVEICPDFFVMKGDVAVARSENVPGDLEEAVREAAENCPVDAIVLEE